MTFGTGAFAQVMTGEQPLALAEAGLIATVAWQTFLQFLADITDKRILRKASVELTAYGCALLAGADADEVMFDAPSARECYGSSINSDERSRRLEAYRAAKRAVLALNN